MSMDGLGRVFNVIPTAADTAYNMDGYDAVTYVCVGADAYTITVGATSAAADDIGAVITHYYENASAVGAAAWVKTAVSPANNHIDTTANGVFTIHASMVPSGKKWIKCTSTGAGTVVAIFHDIKHQRGPANLPIPNV